MLVKNGLEMESFLDKLVASAGNSQLAVIDSSRGIATSNHRKARRTTTTTTTLATTTITATGIAMGR